MIRIIPIHPEGWRITLIHGMIKRIGFVFYEKSGRILSIPSKIRIVLDGMPRIRLLFAKNNFHRNPATTVGWQNSSKNDNART